MSLGTDIAEMGKSIRSLLNRQSPRTHSHRQMHKASIVYHFFDVQSNNLRSCKRLLNWPVLTNILQNSCGTSSHSVNIGCAVHMYRTSSCLFDYRSAAFVDKSVSHSRACQEFCSVRPLWLGGVVSLSLSRRENAPAVWPE